MNKLQIFVREAIDFAKRVPGASLAFFDGLKKRETKPYEFSLKSLDAILKQVAKDTHDTLVADACADLADAIRELDNEMAPGAFDSPEAARHIQALTAIFKSSDAFNANVNLESTLAGLQAASVAIREMIKATKAAKTAAKAQRN